MERLQELCTAFEVAVTQAMFPHEAPLVTEMQLLRAHVFASSTLRDALQAAIDNTDAPMSKALKGFPRGREVMRNSEAILKEKKASDNANEALASLKDSLMDPGHEHHPAHCDTLAQKLELGCYSVEQWKQVFDLEFLEERILKYVMKCFF